MHAMRIDLPNARTVSNQVVWDKVNGGETVDPTGYSGFMYAWGQFITHELASERTGGANIDVIVPPGDTNLTPGSHIPVSRAQVAAGTGINGVVALPINDVTGWIDGCVVYGIAYPPGVTPVSGFRNPVLIREGGQNATTGKLSTSAGGQYGPIDPTTGQFIFGDPRGTENPDLMSIQTLFIREHNWHATRLAQLHPTWSGEQIYQRARSIVIAEEQVITYKEWLPKVLGATAIPAYTGFKPDVDASIKVEFAAAALRFGHSIVSGAQDRIDEQGNVTEALALADAFFLTPAQFERNGGANGFLRKLAADISNKLDVYIIEDLRNLLDDPPAAMDLASTNIQRGRDLGLPSLNQMRTGLGLTPYTSFSQITSDITVSTALQTAYVNIDNIDLWVGGLAENRVVGAMVGETFRTIMIDQFIRLRDGDNQWYENQPWAPGDLTWLRNSTLADIILRNTDTVKIQPDVFVAVERADLYLGVVTSAVARTNGINIPGSNTIPVNLNVISGSLPPGLNIVGNTITGTPYSVADFTVFTFCVRATSTATGEIADRTYSITIDGPDAPEFVTPTGRLAVGTHHQMYVLDKTYINYQIEAFDLDTSAGQKLTYFISSGDGNLPPGLTMSSDGKISGFILPAIKIKPADNNGTYDETYYDAAAFDFGLRATNGFDSYIYDRVFYDYNLPNLRPSTLNVNYQFKVTVSDGTSVAQRIFKIFVVGDDQFRADTTTTDGFADELFTADVTYLRQPAWLTNPNIGLFRANNYLTVPVALYDDSNVIYNLELINQEIKAQAVNILPSDNYKHGNKITVTNVTGTIQPGYYCHFEGIIPGATDQLYKISVVENLGNGRYRLTVLTPLQVSIPTGTSFYIGTLSTLPKGTIFDIQTATIYGLVPYQPAITKTYNFTITATRFGDKQDSATASRTFTIGIIGEIDSVITWLTDANLGNINANFISNLQVSASSTIPDAIVSYTLISGSLPPGLSLNYDGEIIGKVNQFYDAVSGLKGITRFYDDVGSSRKFLTFDFNTTSIDQKYVFTVQARDQYDYSATTRTFSLYVDTPNSISFSNIRTKPFLKQSQRALWKSFINDTSIFTPGSIYRTNDANFGVQTDLNMLVYAGIETKDAARFVGAIGLNHKRKRFTFGTIKSAVAIQPGTTKTVYEVIYVSMIDPQEPNGKYLPRNIQLPGLSSDTITIDSSNSIWSRTLDSLGADSPESVRPEPIITVDSTGYEVSNPNVNSYFPNSITNWRGRIKDTGITERNYMPLWMRSIQPGGSQELGFVLAMPICYCEAGKSADILLNIQNSKFDFKFLDYTVDRYIIDSVTGSINDKYLVFRNDRITV
jgi:hypothetical protein